MTKEARTFLINFISRADTNNELFKIENEILDFFSEIVTCKNEIKSSKIVKLEDNFLKYIDLVKYQYFNYGILAQSLEENQSLTFIPEGLNEVDKIKDQ